MSIYLKRDKEHSIKKMKSLTELKKSLGDVKLKIQKKYLLKSK